MLNSLIKSAICSAIVPLFPFLLASSGYASPQNDALSSSDPVLAHLERNEVPSQVEDLLARGDYFQAFSLIEQGAPVNPHWVDKDGRPLLYHAAYYWYWSHSPVQRLIAQGADVNFKIKGTTSITQALLEDGPLRATCLLLAEGGYLEFNEEMPAHKDLLEYVAQDKGDRGDRDMRAALSLLKGGATFTGPQLSMLACKAVQSGHQEALDVFLENGASVHHINEDNLSFFHTAFMEDHWSLAVHILKKGVETQWGRLERFIRDSMPDMANTYVARYVAKRDLFESFHLTHSAFNCPPKGKRRGQETIIPAGGLPLISYGVLMEDVDLVQELLANADNPRQLANMVDVFGNTPLFYALSLVEKDLISLLLKAGADPLIKNRLGQTSLMSLWGPLRIFQPLRDCGTGEAREELTRFLVEKGVDIHASDEGGNTVLHYIGNGEILSSSMIKFFAEKRARFDLVNMEFRNSFDSLAWMMLPLSDTMIKELWENIHDPLYSLLRQQALGRLVDELEIPSSPHTTVIGIPASLGFLPTQIFPMARAQQAKDPSVHFYILNPLTLENDRLMGRLDGFLLPDAVDNYPQDRPFKISDLENDTVTDTGVVYQRVNQVSRKYKIPLMGFGSGNQHIALYHGATLNLIQDYAGVNQHHAYLALGSLPYYLALTRSEKEGAFSSCSLPFIVLRDIDTDHHFVALSESFPQELGLGALSEEGVVQAVHYGGLKVGFQFHPEHRYFDSPNRQKLVIENFFDVCKQRHAAAQQGKGREGVEAFEDSLLDKLAHLNFCDQVRGGICPAHFHESDVLEGS